MGNYMIIDLDTGHFAFENLEAGDSANRSAYVASLDGR